MPVRIVPKRAESRALVVLLGLAGLGGLAEARGAEAKVPTYTKDVAPLLFKQCASCHRPGEVAPFSLLNYRDASKRAGLIQTAVSERAMPPWKAEKLAGGAHFADERRLSDAEIALIDRWAEAGAPEGDPADLPPTPEFVSGWQLGKPDAVLKMAEPYELVAEGPDQYRCFVIPMKVPPGKYLKAIEYRPGNRRIVHHAVLAQLPHQAAQAKLDAGDGKSFGSGLAPPGQILSGPIAFWTPGMMPRPLPEGMAATWSDGADLVLQLHLHPSGKVEAEQSSLGLYFTDEKPRTRLRLAVLNNSAINIPPGEAAYKVTRSITLPSEVEVFGIFPHMHWIGRSVRVTATLPDGSVRSLIGIDDWNFNWQYYYQYARPVRLPAGTKLEGVWTYDNSESNPANPSKPPKRVYYGEQTADEMAIVILDMIPTGASKPSTAARAPLDPEERARRMADAMGMLDRDHDGKISRKEIQTLIGDRITPEELDERIKEYDKNGDKELDEKELGEFFKSFGGRR